MRRRTASGVCSTCHVEDAHMSPVHMSGEPRGTCTCRLPEAMSQVHMSGQPRGAKSTGLRNRKCVPAHMRAFTVMRASTLFWRVAFCSSPVPLSRPRRISMCSGCLAHALQCGDRTEVFGSQSQCRTHQSGSRLSCLCQGNVRRMTFGHCNFVVSKKPSEDERGTTFKHVIECRKLCLVPS